MSKTTNKFAPEVREHAVRMVADHGRVSLSLGSGGVDRREDWLRAADAARVGEKAEVDSGKRAGVPTEIADKVNALERENRELRQANEILSKASAYFAQAELGRPFGR